MPTNTYFYSTTIGNLTEGNMLPSTILQLFQRAAGEHATTLGCGRRALEEKGLLWVVLQTRHEICKMPKEGQQVRVYTWPLPATRLGYERNYLISDMENQVLIKGSSLWGIIDAKERKLAQVGEVYPEMDFFLEKTFPDRARRLKDFETEAPLSTIEPNILDIDENDHVNNTVYPSYPLVATNGFEGQLQSLQIDYFHEVLYGEPLDIYRCREGNTSYFKGENKEGQRMFACAFTYR